MHRVTNEGKYDQIIYPDNRPTLIKAGESVLVKNRLEGTSTLKVEKIKHKKKSETNKEVE